MWWLAAVACLAASLLPLSGAGAAEDSAVADESASSAAETSAEAAPGDSAGGVAIARYAGSDAYELSIEMAQALVDAGSGSSEWVVLASGESWTDAAAAGPLAASLDAPVVLVPPGGLQASTARPDLVEFLRSAGVRRVVIVGNSDVLPNHEPSVLFGLGMLPRNIERVHDADPVGAAIAVAERIGTPEEFGDLGRTVIITSDRSVADAVAAGPLAAAGPFPLLLSTPDALDPRITAYLTEHEITHVVLAGGATAIAPTVQEAIETVGVAVTRLSGENRHHTAALAMDLLDEVPRCTNDAIDSIALAHAQEPHLASTAGPLLGPVCIPLLFTDADRLPPVTHNHLYLHRHRAGIEPDWFLIGDDVTIDPPAIERPPVRMATVADNPDGAGQHIVVLDEHHQARHYLLDGGFEWITQVRWSVGYDAIRFWGRRNGASQSYVLDPRSGELNLVQHTQSWYATFVQDNWLDVRPSADRRHIVYRASAGQRDGHSVLVYDVRAGSSRILTHNETDDTHHVPASIRLQGSRHLYLHQAINDLGRCYYVPSSGVGILNIDSDTNHDLPFEGYVIDRELSFSPDRSHIVLTVYPEYAFAPEVNLFGFWFWGCTYYGVGPATLVVYAVSSDSPVRIAGMQMNGISPKWSPDGRRLVFQASLDGSSGHSLYVMDLEVGNIIQITQNSSDDFHHVAQHWLPDGERFVYSVQSIDELENTCNGLVLDQQRPGNVPHVAAYVADVSEQTSTRIPFDGFALDIVVGERLSVLPDGYHIAFRTYGDYYQYSLQGECRYAPTYSPELPPAKFYVFDLKDGTPQPPAIEGLTGAQGHWSPDDRYLAYWKRHILDDGAERSEYAAFDTQSNSTWTIDPAKPFGGDAVLSLLAWSSNSRHLIFRVTSLNDPHGPEARAVADVEQKVLSALELTEYSDSNLRFQGFSPDGWQAIHGDHGTYNRPGNYSPNAGVLYINNIDVGGTLTHVFDLYAVSEPAEPVYSQFTDDFGETEQNFALAVAWTPEGIFAAGYYDLDRYWDF